MIRRKTILRKFRSRPLSALIAYLVIGRISYHQESSDGPAIYLSIPRLDHIKFVNYRREDLFVHPVLELVMTADLNLDGPGETELMKPLSQQDAVTCWRMNIGEDCNCIQLESLKPFRDLGIYLCYVESKMYEIEDYHRNVHSCWRHISIECSRSMCCVDIQRMYTVRCT